MNNIKMVKDEIGNIYLSQENLLEIFSERMAKFPDQLIALKGPQQSKVVGVDGKTKTIPSNPIEVARIEGMETMLSGIVSMINITDDTQ